MQLSNKNIVIIRNPDRIKKTKKLLENHETAIQGNAADSTTAQEGIKLAVDKYGPLHGLYHVASRSGLGKGNGCYNNKYDPLLSYR